VYCDPVWRSPSIRKYCEAKLAQGKKLPQSEALSAWSKRTFRNKRMEAWRRKVMKSKAMEKDAENYYACKYLSHFALADFRTALANIPAIMQWDDHDIFDGWGSYPPMLQTSVIFKMLFAKARYFYLLFQHHTTYQSLQQSKWRRDHNYVGPVNTSSVFYVFDKLAIFALDTRTERSLKRVMSPASMDAMLGALKSIPAQLKIKHLIFMTPVPVIAPPMKYVMNLMSMIEKTKLAMYAKHSRLVNMFGSIEFLDDGADKCKYKKPTVFVSVIIIVAFLCVCVCIMTDKTDCVGKPIIISSLSMCGCATIVREL